MNRWNELKELTRVRVLLFLREPEALFWVFGFPLVLAAVLGWAFRSSEVDPARVGIPELPSTVELRARLAEQPDIEVVTAASLEECFADLRRAKVDAVVEPGDPPRVSFDPVRQEALAARLLVERALRIPSEAPAMEFVAVEETGSRYIDFLFPGLLGMNLMGTGMWGIGFTIADIRRRKLLRRMLVTPMRKTSFFLSYMLSRAIFLVFEVAVLVSFGAFVLDVPMEGSLLDFALVVLAGAMAFAGLGLLVASRAQTMEGVSGLMNLVMMPMWLGSGVFFSYERFPEAAHPLLAALPLSGLNDALRAVMLEGEGLSAFWPDLGMLVLWGVGTFLVALKIFRWE